MKRYNTLQICNYFIDKSVDDNDVDDLTLMKLMNLLYYSYGWNLTIFGQSLIYEKIEVSKWGPLLPSVYDYFKYRGNNPIIKPAIYDDYLLTPLLNDKDLNKLKVRYHFEDCQENLLNEIWTVYKKYSPVCLSNSTFKDGSQYKIAKNNGDDIISDKIIKEYFDKLKNGQK